MPPQPASLQLGAHDFLDSLLFSGCPQEWGGVRSSATLPFPPGSSVSVLDTCSVRLISFSCFVALGIFFFNLFSKLPYIQFA